MKYTILVFLGLNFAINSFAADHQEPYQWGKRQIPASYTQEQVNNIVIQTGLKVYEEINRHWRYGNDIKQTHTKAENWQISINIIPSIRYLSSDFANFGAILISPTDAECMTAKELSIVFALLELLGEHNFTEAIKKANHASLSVLTTKFTSKIKDDESLPGHYLGIKNLDSYKYFKPKGSSSNHNVLCVSKNSYMGFEDKTFRQGPQNKQQILHALYEDLKDGSGVAPNESARHEKYIHEQIPNFDKFSQKIATESLFYETEQTYLDAEKINYFLQRGNFSQHKNVLND